MCILNGYSSLASGRAAHANAHWILVPLVFVIMCFFPLLAMANGRRFGVETFRRPSFNRHPIGLWRDTLQPVRVAIIGFGLVLVGACFALPNTDHYGVMLFWIYAAQVLGLFIGERLVYVVYAKRIA